MTPLYHCPWCVVVERGPRASASMRKHILERHRAVLVRGLRPIEFSTRHVGEYPRNAAKGHRCTEFRGVRSQYQDPCLLQANHPGPHEFRLNPGVSGEGDSS